MYQYGAARRQPTVVDHMPKTTETAFNAELATALRKKHPRWPGRIGVEQTNVFSEAAGLRPDIIIRHPGGLPVAVETEYTPAQTVEQDAQQRLGKTLQETGDKIEQAIAVRIPGCPSQRQARMLLERKSKERAWSFAFYQGDPERPDRWPETGWVDGTVNDLAACIELAAHSENRIASGLRILEKGISQAAGKLREDCADAPGTLEAIARELHQGDSNQTSRMAMAILVNALTFHTAIAGAHEIDTLDQLRGADGRISKTKVLDVWRHILENINYWPIFKIASDILLPIRNGTAQVLLDRLTSVASQLDSIGATSQHDLAGPHVPAPDRRPEVSRHILHAAELGHLARRAGRIASRHRLVGPRGNHRLEDRRFRLPAQEHYSTQPTRPCSPAIGGRAGTTAKFIPK